MATRYFCDICGFQAPNYGILEVKIQPKFPNNVSKSEFNELSFMMDLCVECATKLRDGKIKVMDDHD